MARYARDNEIKIKGLHFHIGSNWRTEEEIGAFLNCLKATLKYGKEIKEIIGQDFEFLDVGGGPGVRYRESHPEFPLDQYAGSLAKVLDKSKLQFNTIIFEPGRYISADAGLMLATVVDVKKKDDILIGGTNTGFSQLPRPELYNSHHHVSFAERLNDKADSKVGVVGKVCETGDYLSRDSAVRKLMEPKEGELIAFHTTGSYVDTMTMPDYNQLGFVPTLAIKDGRPYDITVKEVILRRFLLS